MSATATLKALRQEVARVVVGQRELIEGLLVALLARGHALVEGVPGLAKTTAVRTLARALGLEFRRIQFTPDLLPSDLLGSPIYEPSRGGFRFRPGPVFCSVLLADEINRAPAKVQSALLEAMEERQVTVGETTHPLPDPFFVMATQNPVELEGTYPLPEAQLDRFLVKLVVRPPDFEEEIEIVARDSPEPPEPRPVADAQRVRQLQREAARIHLAPEVREYAVRVVRATREPRPLPSSGSGARSEAARALALGASPRASVYLARAARARALLEGRDFVIPYDVKRMARDVLRHRLVLSYEAEAEGLDADTLLDEILSRVDPP